MSSDTNDSSSQEISSDIMYIPAMTKEELFDHIARDHDGFAFTVEDSPKVIALNERLGDISGMRVIEPGCGSGHLTAYLADWVGPSGQVVAFDPSEGMIERTRKRTSRLPQVGVHREALETIKLPDASFDRVVCFRVWPHFDDENCTGSIAHQARLCGSQLDRYR